MSRFLIGLVFLLVAQVGGPSFAQVPLATTGTTETTEAIAEPSPNDIKELARLLGDPTVVNWLEQRAAGLAGDEQTTGLTFEQSLDRAVDRIEARVEQVVVALMILPQTPTVVAETWRGELTPRERLNLVVLLIIFVFIGAGLEWLYWRYAGHAKRRIELRRSETYLSKTLSAATRFALTSGGALCFAIGTIGTFVMFDWPPGARDFVLDLLIVLVLMRLVAAVALFALAPRVEALRLVPLSRYDARLLYFGVLGTAAVLLFGGGLAETTVLLGGNEPAGLAIDIAAGAVTGVLVVLLLWLMYARSHTDQRHILTPVIGSAVVLMLFILWLIGADRAAGTLAILALLVPTARILRQTILHAFEQSKDAKQKAEPLAATDDAAADTTDEATAAETDDDADEEEPQADRSLYLPVAIRLGRFTVVVIGLLSIGLVWGVEPWELSDIESTPGQIVRILVDVMVAYLIGDLIWTATKTAIDRKMADMPKMEHGVTPGPEARMATLLPLIKKTVLVTVIIMVALIGLAAMGVNIAPLLAGAGVVGLAIGFGAQALVRDIVSGVFFLIDDAFRVGEYIEMGELRGTVESISIRSLRVRHHRGAIHTIPFGELKSLTNYSRD
ncbi:MAG: mechanosensitive ion channel domain-containing protein, partial [Pseudomonadota bacterium]